MKHCGSFLYIWIFALVHTGPDLLVQAAMTREITFVRNINPVQDPASPTGASPTPTNLSQFMCGVQCLAAFPACTSYLHNSSTGLCVQSAKPGPLVSQLESGLGDLYVTCDTPGGYTMYRHGSAAACISVVKSPKVNFTLASSHCEGMGGYLASVKTLDKLHLLNNVLGSSNNFWVGMDDMAVEGTYVWKEDGSVGLQINATYSAREMAEIAMNGMWDHPREPNNYLNDEHCVQLKLSSTHNEHRLNDYKCYTRSKFLCEERIQFV
ncbi:C-type lectin-related protein 4 [Elysia marginata]|uniref:C-type lectin-related protein 4 n=1 Tax=Elysia marginata TaxID=1093978 RepID=A0AAV4H907_9GAST|nr:C-type lectin-related protein 4 [Elysia marginata]